MFGDPKILLEKPELVATTWLNFAATMWFFVTPQPPKPSMLQVLDGSWVPNAQDLASNLKPGFGVTTMIINGAIECGKWTLQAENREKYYKDFAEKLGVSTVGEKINCDDMQQFSDKSSSSQALYWGPGWHDCKLVTWQTAYSALVEGDYNKCKGLPSTCSSSTLRGCTAPTPPSIPTPTPAPAPGVSEPENCESPLPAPAPTGTNSKPCGGAVCGSKSSEPISNKIQAIRDSTSCTLENSLVELISPGSASNPQNVRNVENIMSEAKFNEFFPNRNSAYSYTNFLKAIGKYPTICSSASLCPKILANMFGHFQQETAGLKYLEEIQKSAYCATWSTWVVEAYPCIPGKQYYGRGAKQLSWNYNYGAFSSAMFGDPKILLEKPELVATTWLNFAATMWFFVTPQPPKPSMLQVLDGSWVPNAQDLASNLKPGFGVTTMIINGAIECGKWSAQAKNRADFYGKFANQLGVNIAGEKLNCNDMRPFGEGSSANQALYWGPSANCQLVTWQTAYSALVEGDYNRCKGLPSTCSSSPLRQCKPPSPATLPPATPAPATPAPAPASTTAASTAAPSKSCSSFIKAKNTWAGFDGFIGSLNFVLDENISKFTIIMETNMSIQGLTVSTLSYDFGFRNLMSHF